MKKEFPAQTTNRLRIIVETIREHQDLVRDVLCALRDGDDLLAAALVHTLYETEKWALMHPEGILSEDQRKRIEEA